jgi:hypothetical protein
VSFAKVYIASRLENAAAVRELRDELAKHDVVLTYDWTEHGSVQNEGAERMRDVAHAEASGVEEADLVIVLLPGGRGTHVEIGIAIGAGVDILLVGEQQSEGHDCAFYNHDACFRVPAGSAVELANHVEHMLNLEDLRAEHASVLEMRASAGQAAEPARAPMPRGHLWPSVT